MCDKAAGTLHSEEVGMSELDRGNSFGFWGVIQGISVRWLAVHALSVATELC